jgi:hypothetical protein
MGTIYHREWRVNPPNGPVSGRFCWEDDFAAPRCLHPGWPKSRPLSFRTDSKDDFCLEEHAGRPPAEEPRQAPITIPGEIERLQISP